ncbi:hypothetical protein HAPAU_29110 [Halalkalicoccus paucihalophilus]|uniref:Uncharacterized protein n=1 Tax=Halalkalicoccus paucihalophilus TaxID=1008153 RepID=A0A151ABF7_9EURY|nr:hypothetical protein HAPAU_29110 [Halalkalicoccus paucihalophilus]
MTEEFGTTVEYGDIGVMRKSALLQITNGWSAILLVLLSTVPQYERMEKPTTDDELQTALEDDRYRILECLAVHDELSSGEIRDCAKIPKGSKYYQLSIPKS